MAHTLWPIGPFKSCRWASIQIRMSNFLRGAKQRDRALRSLWRGHHKTMYRSELCQKFSSVLFLQRGALLTSACTNSKESSDVLQQAGKLATKSRDEANIVQCPAQMQCTNPGVFCTFQPYPNQFKMLKI